MSHTPFQFSTILLGIARHPWRVALPTLALTILSVAYAVVRPNTWEASQALVVRDEVGDRLTRPGKFAHADEMKNSQETILELARSRGVLVGALEAVGPPEGYQTPAAWPTDKDLETLQAKVKIAPPKGAEFGKTEVFYLVVQDQSRDRAIALSEAICGQLQTRLGQLREAKARSTTEELEKTVALARENLAEATKALGDLEQHVGGDLAELRMLNELPSGDSDLRRTALELEKELRAYQASQTENDEFLQLLKAAYDDPGKLLASPSLLMKSQPAIGRLKDGLVDAQLRTGQVLGTMSEKHPLAQGARAAEEAIRQQLHDEISVAIRGVEADLRVNAERIRSLETQCADVQARLSRLAAVRAEYANLVTATKSRGEALKAVEHDEAEARASQSAARSSSLIHKIDRPNAGTQPLGPGRTMIVAAGWASGLLIGLAIVLLSIHPAAASDITAHASNEQARPRPARTVSPIADRATSLTLRQALERISKPI